MTRISDIAMQQILLQGFQRAQGAAQATQIQLASGDKFQNYGGYGADALRLISSEGVVTRASAFETAGKIAQSRLEGVEANLVDITSAAEGIRASFTQALATGSAELLLPDLEVAAQRILTALNSQLGGTYLFGGDDGTVPPVAAQSLSDLGAAASVDALFAEGARLTLAVEEGVSVDGGPRASDVARELLGQLRELANAEAALGPFSGELTDAQRTFLIDKSAALGAIADTLYEEQGILGAAQFQADQATERNRQKRELAEIVAAEIENTDIAEAVSRLNQDQLAIQAAGQTLAQASQLSLLNFL